MSYGQSSYGGLAYGDTQTVVLPQFIEPGALAVSVTLHAPDAVRISGVLQPGVLTITVTAHEPAMREPAVPIARHVRQMAVRRTE